MSAAAWLVPGSYAIPGIGEVLITATLVVYLGKKIIEAGTKEYKDVQKGVEIHFSKEAEEAKKDIPQELKDKDGNVDLGKFITRTNGGKNIKAKNGWYVQKDKGASSGQGSHGGSAYKLYNKQGRRKATLGINGKVLRK